MKARLIIKNFGPITDLDIEIKKYNILIGPQASGKSTIAKLLCAIQDCFKGFLNSNQFSIDNTNIDFENEDIQGSKLTDFNKFFRLLIDLRISTFYNPISYILFKDDLFSFILDKYNIYIKCSQFLNDKDPIVGTYYIPPERIALQMIGEALFQLTVERSPLPQSFLQYGSDFIIARGLFDNNKKIPIFDLDLVYKDGRNFIKRKNEESLMFEEASSAIQANVPLLLILEYSTRPCSIFVIEELELHCYPKLQKELLYHVIEKTRHQTFKNTYVVLPTHSPYILSAANNLLFANKVGNQSEKTRLETNKIINQASWIDRDDFAAYYIDNGTAISIVNGQTGLIDENELDSISEDLGEEFDLLMDLYKPAHA